MEPSPSAATAPPPDAIISAAKWKQLATKHFKDGDFETAADYFGRCASACAAESRASSASASASAAASASAIAPPPPAPPPPPPSRAVASSTSPVGRALPLLAVVKGGNPRVPSHF